MFEGIPKEDDCHGCTYHRLSNIVGYAPFETVGCICRGFHADGFILC